MGDSEYRYLPCFIFHLLSPSTDTASMSGFSLLEFIQQIINGLTLGSIYALIAIGYTMVYGIIGMINFAHGEIYMIGAYVGLLVITALGLFGVDSISMRLILGFEDMLPAAIRCPGVTPARLDRAV